MTFAKLLVGTEFVKLKKKVNKFKKNEVCRVRNEVYNVVKIK